MAATQSDSACKSFMNYIPLTQQRKKGMPPLTETPKPLAETMRLLSTISFLILLFASCGNGTESKELLYAFREAPIGGEFFRLTDSSTFEYGPTRSANFSFGTYSISNDTLKLTYNKQHRPEVPNYFLIRKNRLMPIDKSGAPLEIKLNNLKR
jgi:hypothetical protein